MHEYKLLFIGGGNISKAIIQGLIANGYPANKIWVVDPNFEKLKYFSSELNIITAKNPKKLFKLADIILLSIKPYSIFDFIKKNSLIIKKTQALIISIIAGITCDDLHKYFGQKKTIVRCMPNIPVSINYGISSLYTKENKIDLKSQKIVENIFQKIGKIIWIKKEEDMDLITAISGSSPGYIYLIMEIIESCALDMGLEKNTAKKLIVNSMVGISQLALLSKKNFHSLRKKVSSKGGTTEAAINSLNEDSITDIIRKAIISAQNKSIYIGKNIKKKLSELKF